MQEIGTRIGSAICKSPVAARSVVDGNCLEGIATGARLGAYGTVANSENYADVVFEEIVSPAAHDIARQMADLCQLDPVDSPTLQALTADLDGQPVVIDANAGALRHRLQENVPGGEVTAPLLTARGMDDIVIAPSVRDGFVAERCADGQSLTYWRIPVRNHGGIDQPDSPLTEQLIAWTADRFADLKSASGCTGETIESAIADSIHRQGKTASARSLRSSLPCSVAITRLAGVFG